MPCKPRRVSRNDGLEKKSARASRDVHTKHILINVIIQACLFTRYGTVRSTCFGRRTVSKGGGDNDVTVSNDVSCVVMNIILGLQEKNPHVPSSSSYASASSKNDGRLPDTPPFGLFGKDFPGPFSSSSSTPPVTSSPLLKKFSSPSCSLLGASAWGAAADRLGYLSPFYAYTNGSSAMVSTLSIMIILGHRNVV